MRVLLPFILFVVFALSGFSNTEAKLVNKISCIPVLKVISAGQDQVIPVDEAIFDTAEFTEKEEVEDNDDNTNKYTYYQLISSLTTNLISNTHTASGFLFSHTQHPHFIAKQSLQSYLQVFRL